MTELSWDGDRLRIDDSVHPQPYPIRAAVVAGPVVAVLFDKDAVRGNVGVFENLIGLQADGSRAWTALVPTSTTGDSYLSVEEHDGQLVAFSWSGWRVVIDAATGRIQQRDFVH